MANIPDQIFATLVNGRVWGVRVTQDHDGPTHIDQASGWITTGPAAAFGFLRQWLKEEFEAEAKAAAASSFNRSEAFQ
jgi:hypothetical protein